LLSKIRREIASIVVVTPLWTSQPWFPSLLGLSCYVTRIFRPSENLLNNSVNNKRQRRKSLKPFCRRGCHWKLK
jgi:hypothetical protein